MIAGGRGRFPCPYQFQHPSAPHAYKIPWHWAKTITAKLSQVLWTGPEEIGNSCTSEVVQENAQQGFLVDLTITGPGSKGFLLYKLQSVTV